MCRTWCPATEAARRFWRWGALVLGLAGAAAATAAPARAQQGCPVDALNIALENDALALGQRTDRWYTAGGRVTWSYRCAQPDGPAGTLVRLPGLLLGLVSAQEADQVAVQIGQNLYTPQNLVAADFIPYDRPYAGWTYLGMTAQRQSAHWTETADVRLGVTGPASLAQDVQSTTHRMLGRSAPRGWHWQMRPSAGVEVGYALRRWQPLPHAAGPLVRAGLVPEAGLVAGNLRNLAWAGLSLVVGPGAAPDRVAPLGEGIGEQLPSPGRSAPVGPAGADAADAGFAGSWALSLGYTWLHVASNRFIDGDTYGGRPVIEVRHPVSQVGIALSFAIPGSWFGRPARLALSVYDRSPEFSIPGYGPASRQRVGRLSLTLAL